MAETASTTDWDKVDKLKEKYPEMITFTDVPDGMEFVSVEVAESKNVSFEVTYAYLKDKKEVFVCQRINKVIGQETEGIEKAEGTIKYKDYEINTKIQGKNMEATLTTKNETISVIGQLSEQEVVNILDKIKSL